LKNTYQISLLVNDPILKDNEFVHLNEIIRNELEIAMAGQVLLTMSKDEAYDQDLPLNKVLEIKMHFLTEKC